ncbi:hypothetical protein PLESTB_001003200 [Pleodorina starrii]|uniref:Uncharacterized protein n=1 Tax=Pleodorina starrii TaxID=330485 RepID=A0A9W6BP60_9CHLO|nr:hypothetical protein PLESTM_001204200 [Pleodorina starrii]GLC55583.1 hypothetical protein PLESTB_001003200 [Pleodorina starrii]
MAADEANRRILQLSQSLADRERELVSCNASQAFLKQDLEATKAELTAARDELRNEATKNSLLEQRLKRVTEELQQTRNDLASSTSERDSLNRTLGRVHEQLSSLKTECASKGLALTEAQLHYDGLLAAKEESIRSLQALLDAQTRQLREQQELWEEQRRSLKASLADVSLSAERTAGATGGAAAAAQAAALAELRAKLAVADKAAVKAAEREQKLLELLKHRERQVAKLKGKRNSSGQQGQRSGSDNRGNRDSDRVGDREREHRSGGEGGGGVGDGGGRAAGGRLGVRFADRLLGADSSDDSGCGDTATSLDLNGASPRRGGAAAAKGAAALRESTGNSRSAAVQAALQEERRRHEAARSRLAAAEREADDLRAQVSRLRAELVDAASGSAAGSSMQLADELMRAHRKIQELESQLRRAREGAVAAASEAMAASPVRTAGAGSGSPGLLTSVEHLAIVRQRLVRQRQEFEQLLERVVAGEPGLLRGAPGGVLLPEDVKSLMDRNLSRIDTLASMSALPEGRRGVGDAEGSHTASGAQQQQHSLFVVRAAWSTLRRALMSLQEAVAASLDVGANPAVAYIQGADFLSRIMREWVVGDKSMLDAAVEASMSAAVALVQEASARLQAHTVDAGVARQQLAEAQDEVAQLRLTNSMVAAEGERRLAETRVEVEELRRQVDLARAEVATVQPACLSPAPPKREASSRLNEVEAMRARAEAAEATARRAEAAAASSEVERTRLRKNLALLEGDMGNAEAAVVTREEERLRLSRALSDANATIALLHDRLDAYQATGSSELTALKTRIRDVVTALESPNLPQLHAMMVAAAAEGDGDVDPLDAAVATRSARSNANTPRRSNRRGGGVGGVMSESALNSLALGLHGRASDSNGGGSEDPAAVSASLVAALDSAATSCTAALHRAALLEMAHHEADRGAAAVVAVRAHLASATAEMAAGRVAFGDVLLSELLVMLDEGASPTAAPSPARGSAAAPQTPRARSASSGHWQLTAAAPAGGGGGSGMLGLRSQLAAARDQSQHLMRHLKNMEGLLLALKSALPEWLELATARLAARHRTELSRLRGLLGGQLAALRRDLRDMRASCKEALVEQAQQAADTLEQARRMAASADVDRAEATEHLNHLAKDLHALTELLSSTAAATAAITAGVDPATTASAAAAAAASAATPTASVATTAAGPAMASNGGSYGLATAASGSDVAAAPAAAGGLGYSLVRAVAAAARAVPELRAGCERIRRDAMGLVSDRDKAHAAAGAAAANVALVVRSVAEATPLPEVLVLALLNQAAAPDPSLAPIWCAKLRECLARQLAGVQSAAAEGVLRAQVEPLRREVERLTEELRAAKRRSAALQAQASRFLADSGQALESCRRAAGEAAAAVLDSVMAGVREEVAAVRLQVSDLEEGSSDVLRQANAAWADQLAAVRVSSSAAVAALEESVSLLQEQLGNEADAFDALRAESEAAAREAAERVSLEEQRSRNLSADLAVAKERLSALEAAETTLEGENRGLRKALRQRDMLAMGALQQQQVEEERQQQRSQRASAAGAGRGGDRGRDQDSSRE